MFLKRLEEEKYVLLFLFTLSFFLLRIPYLGKDEINPDAVNWHYRASQFINGLKYFQFEKTYQHYHPGVTLMWITGTCVEVYKQITNIRDYTHLNFPYMHLAAKIGLVVFQYFLSLLIVYLLSKIKDFWESIFVVWLFSVEPFFVGNSRLYHMDVLFTLLVFGSLLFCYLFISKNRFWHAVLAGLFSSLSFLTRSVGIGICVYTMFYAVFFLLAYKNNRKPFFRNLLVYLISFVICTFALFPALWVKPAYYLTEIFKESERIGLREGHGQILLGEYTRDAGLGFYPTVLLIKASPFLLLGVIFSLIFLKKVGLNVKGLEVFTFVFYLGYMTVMIFSSKKIDRYLIVIFPFLAMMCFYGYKAFIYSFSKSVFPKISVGLIFLLFIVVPLFTFFPYYFVYASPLTGGVKGSDILVGQKPFGIGIFQVRDVLVSTYGKDITVGMVDTKPLKSIFPNSQVFDIRVYGPGKYDVIVLGPHEDFTDKVLDGNYRFKKSRSIYIKGLEYWRIYDKENTQK